MCNVFFLFSLQTLVTSLASLHYKICKLQIFSSVLISHLVAVEFFNTLMMSSCHSPTDVHDLVYRQRVLQEQDRNRLAQIMHTAVNTIGLRDVRPTQVYTKLNCLAV